MFSARYTGMKRFRVRLTDIHILVEDHDHGDNSI